MKPANVYLIPGEAFCADAPELKEALVAWCAAKLKKRSLEVGEESCGQIALQLLFGTIDRLSSDGVQVDLGPRATALAACRLSSGN